MKKDNEDSVSLNKFISSTGLCSRREADKMIINNRVKINGKRAELGNRVNDGDKVTIDGDEIENNSKPYYIAYNKPVGIVSTTDPKEKQNIVRYLNHPERLFPIGRLDKDSEGLIFLTNDGDIVNKILRSGNNHEKEYIVTVSHIITPKFIDQMSKGVEILGTVTKKCKVTQIDDYRFNIVLTQGMNRQIRRMCEHFKFKVMKLKRVRIMNIDLGKLKTGHWRVLNEEEVRTIKSLVKGSSKTASRQYPKKRNYSRAKKNEDETTPEKKTRTSRSTSTKSSPRKVKGKGRNNVKKSFSTKAKPKAKTRRGRR